MAKYKFKSCDGEFATKYHCVVDNDDDVCLPETGWYWWPLNAGANPDTDASGPYPTEAIAIAHAN